MDDHDELQQRLRTLGTQPIDPARLSADLTAMASARPVSRVGPKLRVAGAFLAGLLIGSTGLAAADALPDPVQHVAHSVLGRVGVDVPNPARYYEPEACGDAEKKNHGAYVREDHSLAKSDCGKPVKAVGAGDDSGTGEAKPDATAKADKGPCDGKPSWAGNKTMTSEQKAAAQAERAKCGPDDDVDEVKSTSDTKVEADAQGADEDTENTETDTTETAG